MTMQVRKGAVVAIMTGSMACGALGAWLFAPSSGGAATNPPGASINASTGAGGTFHSNEDPTHEKGESAQREADENSGRVRPHDGSFRPNEDPTHEKNESASREAQENAGQFPTP